MSLISRPGALRAAWLIVCILGVERENRGFPLAT